VAVAGDPNGTSHLQAFSPRFAMADSTLDMLSGAPAQSVTRRVFLKSCGAVVGAVATGAAATAAPPLRRSLDAGSAPKGAKGGKPRTFHIMPHSHIDVEWYWTFPTTQEWTKDILDKAMALLRSDPEFRFTQDQVVLLKSYWENLKSDGRAFFKQMVAEGRLAIVGGMYVQPEVAEPSGESLVRQILVGQSWLAATLGIRVRCGWFIDTFGQIPQIPQILRRAGYDAYVFWRDIPPEFPVASLPADFQCESPDGSRIVTHWLAGGYSMGDALVRAAVQHSRSSEVLLPYGSDVSRPTQDSAAMRRDVEARLGKLGIAEPRLRVSTAVEYLEHLRAAADQLPVLHLDFNPPLRSQDLRGTYDNRIELKKRNRAAEQALYSAECLAAIASTAAHAYPQATFQRLWEKLLFTQFHDTMGGSHSDAVYVSAMERLALVLSDSEQMAAASLRQILPGAREVGDWLAVYNTLSFPRSELCQVRLPAAQLSSKAGLRLQDAVGRIIPFHEREGGNGTSPGPERIIEFMAKEVPATGYRAYRLVSAKRRPSTRSGKMGSHALENDRFHLEWDPKTGDVTRLWDKRLGRELLSGPSNVLIAAKERNPDLEGDLHLTGEEVRSSACPALSITPGRDELSLHVSIVNQLPDCLLEREIILFDQLARIDFRTTLRDFAGGDLLVKASFAPRLDWRKVQTVYETPFAATPRPEGHFAAQTWVDCSDGVVGVGLLNRGTPGYWVAGRQLELVLLRSLANYTGYQRSGLRKGVLGFEHSTQTELAREHGTHVFEYALVPHRGSWRSGQLPHLGRSYNTALLNLGGLSGAVSRQGDSSFTTCGPGFVLTAIKGAENGHGLILRGYETLGQAHRVTLKLPKGVRLVQRTSLLEEMVEALPLVQGTVRFLCRPHEIVTLCAQW
jgi:alpha-mannosidase